jgi:hypothetical protein
MANHVLQREEATTIALPTVRRRHLVELGAAIVVGAFILVVAIIVSGRGDEPTPAVQADGLRWEALVASEYPAATPAAVAEAARWQALAEAHADYTILPQTAIATGARWQAMADSYRTGQLAETARLTGLAEHYVRGQQAESARLTGLAEHHLSLSSLSPALQAAADRYQGMAESMK